MFKEGIKMKYCPKCGSEVQVGTTYCGACGSQIPDSINQCRHEDDQSIQLVTYDKKAKSSRKIMAGLIAVVIVLGAAGGGYYYYESSQAAKITAERVAQAEAFAQTPEGKAQKQLEANGVNGNVIATTYTASSSNFLALIDNGDTKSIAAYDAKNNLYISVEDPKKVFDILNTTSKKYNSLIFTMNIRNAPHGEDDKFGEWNGTSHKLPVYVSYQTNNRAEIVPGMINSGVGLHPKQFKSYLQEPVNVDLTNLIVTNIKSLKAAMDIKNIAL